MAKISFKGCADYGVALEKYFLSMQNEAVLKEAICAGASIVADQIRSNLEAIPEDQYRKLKPGEIFRGLSAGQKADLSASFGLSPIMEDRNGNLNTKAGFDGYGSYPSKAYPEGLPNALLARTTESGSSVRVANPFVRPAVNATRKPAKKAMEQVLDEKAKEIFDK